ncbi:DUF2207 domain-containing protein [Betaproteobacteria bacterium PRO7]|jgi:uncharacterized membrane protein YgcG|nr:DUF2207 domain-containing protein [Betaproteobacteria bacterium PRO7]
MRWLLGALLALACVAAAGEEKIVDFAADIAIARDGAVTVAETIVVRAEGASIKRGILRDFPTAYTDRAGNAVRVPFDVVAVRRNGAPEPYALEALSNGVRIRIGRADVLLDRGEHRYEIEYRTARQLGFFAAHDELYWNVTGNGWTFAIDRARARVTLPQPVPAAQLSAEAYTGPFGARGGDYSARVVDGGAEYETTRRLPPQHGLTIVLAFPKGVVAAPSTIERASWFVQDNVGAGVALAGVLAVWAFLYWRWDRIGRDPKPGPRFPRYEPPSMMSAAAVRFVDKMSFDSRCFAAALLGLGARGYLKIHQNGDVFALERTGRDVAFGTGEKAMADKLFGGGKVTQLQKEYDPSVYAAQKALSDALEHHYADVLFRRNRTPLVLAGFAAVATVIGAIVLRSSVPVVIATAVVLAASLLLFAYLLPAYTQQGRKLKDEIDGLRLYLGVAEGDNLARLQNPRLTPEEFAGKLPYALALGVEKTWADRFAAVLGAAAVAQAVSHYYTGSSTDSLADVGSLSSSLGELGTTASAAASPPGSDSGSGGGGASGGGGGGGGGSGW